MNFSLGNQKKFLEKDLGFITGITYNKNANFYENRHVFEIERAKLSDPNLQDLDGSVQIDLGGAKSQESSILGILLSAATLKLNTSHKLGANLIYNRNTSKSTRFLQGQWNKLSPPSPHSIFQSQVHDFIQRDIVNTQFRGKHQIKNNVYINWFSVYSVYTYSYMNEPDLRFLQNSFQVNEKKIEDTLFIISNLNNPGRYYRNLEEITLDNKLNISTPFSLIKNYESK